MRTRNASPRVASVHVAARMPSDLADKFAAIAARHDRTLAQELRRVVRAHVEAAEAAAQAAGAADGRH